MKRIFFQTLDSSNDYLKKKFEHYEDQTVIVVERQTKGRGRFNRSWISEDNDLTFSILFKTRNYSHILIAPLAIVYTLLEYDIISYIKWPNDIYINNLKVSGILIESIFSENNKKCDIIGIGINFTNKENLEISYLNKYGIYDTKKFLDILLNKYEMLLKFNNENLLNLYKENSYMIGKQVIYNNNKYLIENFTINAELILINNLESIIVNANEIDIKNSIIKTSENNYYIKK